MQLRMAIRLGGIVLGLVLFLAAPARAHELVFLHYWTGGLSGGIDAMAAEYNRQNPGHPVRATGFEHESYKLGIKVMLQGGNPPDLFSYWAGARTQALVDRREVAPIDDMWRAEDLDARFAPALAAACTYDGNKYAVPVTQHYVAVFYNKKLFAAHGLAPPRTWKEYMALADVLRDAGVVPMALGARDQWPAQFWFDYYLLRTAGPEYRSRLMRGKASYTDPEVRRAFEMWKQCLDNGHFNDTPTVYDWSEAARQVFHGRAAMTLMGSWIIGLWDGQLGWKQGEDFDFFPFPVVDEAVPDVALGPIDVLLASRGGRTEEAKHALAYFTERGPQQAMSKGSGALAPNRQVPDAFYTPLQQRMREAVSRAPHWAFNYDLATPPRVAQVGLALFSRFLEHPDQLDSLLAEAQKAAARAFATQDAAIRK